MVYDISYNYNEGRTFDHVPIHITLNQDRFQDTMLAAEQPAKLSIRSLKLHTQKQRNDVKDKEVTLFNSVWMTYDSDFQSAVKASDVNLAHSIWCYAAEKFLWLLQGEQTELPKLSALFA